MSQRKDRKRRRDSEEDSPERGSVLDVLKRKRLEQVLDVLKSNKDGSQIEPEVQVRRSGRTPKAKVFDDDYVTENVRSSESPRVATYKSPATSYPDHEEVLYMDDKRIKVKKERVDLDAGHKRETRRSYQQYLEELGNQSNVSEGSANKQSKERQKTSPMDIRKVKLEAEEETEMYSQPVLTQRDSTRQGKSAKQKEREKARTGKEMKQQLIPGSSGWLDDSGFSGWADTEVSPKRRASSRAPVPKRTFPLLQASLHHSVSEREKLSRDETKCMTITEIKVEVQEELSKVSAHKVRTSTRTPVPKRSFSLLEDEGTYHVKEEVHSDVEVEEEEPQGSQISTPSEPTPARSSSRTPVPKRTFTLLGSLKEKRKEKAVPSDREEVNVEIIGAESLSSKKRKKGYSPGVMIGQGDSPVLSAPDGSHIDKVTKQQKSTKNRSDKVTKKKMVKELGGVSGEVNPDMKRKVKRKSSKKDLPDVVIKQETVGDGSAMGQGVYETPKSQRKSLLLKESAKNSPSRSENSVSLADLALEISQNLTSLEPSDDAKRAKPKMKSGQKIKHAAKKHSHNDDSPRKIRRNVGEASSEVFEEEEHIILKLHLPHSSADHASNTGSKKHKHRHASESQDVSGSPKKKHHKKSRPVEKESAAKKKISLKFKGLSTRHIDLEVGGASSGDSTKVVRKPASTVKKKSGHSGKTGGKSTASTSLEGSGKKRKKSTGENAPSTHSQAEAGNVSKDKENKDSSSKEKGARKENSRTVAGGSSNKPGTSKKRKEGSPSKNKHNEKPKVVSSYLLFGKQERPRIVKKNPGLDFAQISKKVGEAWHSLSDEEKQLWREKAEIENHKSRDIVDTVEPYSQQLLEPIDMAAHLRLLGESLLTIGVCLGQQNEMEVHGSLSVLLDSVLCAMSPLLFITSQVPELNGCPKEVQAAVLDNLGHIMPGLG